ncbi:hypothetical protein IWW52_004034, partial [Coemansia sp. RSA 2704]
MKCTFVDVAPESDFSIQNLPFGIFSANALPPQVGVAIGDHVLCMSALAKRGLFSSIPGLDGQRVFGQPQLNEYMSLGRPVWRAVRQALQEFLSESSHPIRQQPCSDVLVPLGQVQMHLPAKIGDYTDFYASREHATNVGIMFRGKENALMPNWTHLPVGYHGRASSVVVSGTDLRRPNGQRRPDANSPPVFGQSARLDYELEMGFFFGGPANDLGVPLTVDQAEERIFGVVLMNDWSARDIQAWEYVPLGPFLGKSFGTSISPWVVSMDALEPFRVMQPLQDPEPLAYLREKSADSRANYDINLNVHIRPHESGELFVLSKSNLKYMYWSLRQQLAHHTINGCNMRAGDLCGTGTIS